MLANTKLLCETDPLRSQIINTTAIGQPKVVQVSSSSINFRFFYSNYHLFTIQVTPENFLSVLIGNETLVRKGKKVLNSTHNDHVFVYFADHGAPGLLAFPEGELMATDLIKTLHAMNAKRMFKHLVFYVEACESGSMFKRKLPENINIFAVTAANDQESSYACYWDEKRQTFLGDVFSVEWIEDSEKRVDLDTESVQQQYQIVAKLTNTSHVKEFGDTTIARLPLGQFQGERRSAGNDETPRVDPFLDAVPSHDVPLIIAQRRAKAAADPFERAHLNAKYQGMLNARAYMKSAVQSLSKKLQSHGVIPASNDLFRERKTLTRTTCYEKLYKTFDEYCFDLSTHPHSLRFLYVLVNACESMQSESSELVSQASDLIRDHCSRANFGESLFRSIR